MKSIADAILRKMCLRCTLACAGKYNSQVHEDRCLEYREGRVLCCMGCESSFLGA
jgi:hypothetical protein